MAFQTNNLSVLAYANGFTLWHYRTEDELGEIVGGNYFNGAANMLRLTDVIIVQSKLSVDLFCVTHMEDNWIMISSVGSGASLTKNAIQNETKKRDGMKFAANVPGFREVTAMCIFKEKIFIAVGDTIYTKDANDDSDFTPLGIQYAEKADG